jgi:hypothetical protein
MQKRQEMGHASRKVKITQQDKRGDRIGKGILYHTKEVGYRTGQEMDHNREWAMPCSKKGKIMQQDKKRDRTRKGI